MFGKKVMTTIIATVVIAIVFSGCLANHHDDSDYDISFIGKAENWSPRKGGSIGGIYHFDNGEDYEIVGGTDAIIYGTLGKFYLSDQGPYWYLEKVDYLEM
jgi:hypothetical protein